MKSFRQKKSHLCVVMFLFSLFSVLYSQDIQWEKTLGGKKADYLMDAIPTADYGFIMAGSSLSSTKDGTKGNYNFCIWKIKENGDIEWEKSYGGIKNDLLSSIKATADGGYILAGTSNSAIGIDKKDANIGQQDIWIIKLDATGSLQWQKTLGGVADEQVNAILQTRDGGYIIGGSSESDSILPYKKTTSQDQNNKTIEEHSTVYKSEDSKGNLDYWIVKLDSKGVLVWQKTYGSNYYDQLRSLIQTQDGGYFVGGISNSDANVQKSDKNYGNYDFWFMKLDSFGDVIWEKSYGAEGDDQLYTVVQTTDKGFMIAGNSNSIKTPKGNSTEGSDFIILKTDEAGNTEWEKTYHIESNDVLTNLVKNKDESFLISGYSRRKSNQKTNGKEEYAVIKIAQNGDEIWRKTIGKQGKNVLNKAIETRDGGYILAGTSLLSKVVGNEEQIDFWIVKLKDRNKPEYQKAMLEAMPNPATYYTNIIIGYEYNKGQASLYDIAGRQLQSFAITSRTVPIDISQYPDGIYIVNIDTDVQREGIKIVKSNER